MCNESQISMDTFGGKLARLRNSLKLPQATIAAAASISTGYYSAIESNSRLPPPSETLTRILLALHCTTTEAKSLQIMAACERNLFPFEANLSLEVQGLIVEIRKQGDKLSSRLIRALRTHIREAAKTNRQ